jgi:hypothetical protein
MVILQEFFRIFKLVDQGSKRVVVIAYAKEISNIRFFLDRNPQFCNEAALKL